MSKQAWPYTAPEMVEMHLANESRAKYWVHYASDVGLSDWEWWKDAMPLLEDYAVVMPFWASEGLDTWVSWAKREPGQKTFETTPWGIETHMFSDQCFMVKLPFKPNLNCRHPIKQHYPAHGGNSFERRVAQWLARTNQKVAVMGQHHYNHQDNRDK